MACTSESKHSLGLLVQQLYQRHNKQQQMFDISVPNKKKTAWKFIEACT